VIKERRNKELKLNTEMIKEENLVVEAEVNEKSAIENLEIEVKKVKDRESNTTKDNGKIKTEVIVEKAEKIIIVGEEEKKMINGSLCDSLKTRFNIL
jgi:hypothetical protein